MEELKFPIEGADSCPSCGSYEKVVEQTIAKLKEDKRLSEKAFPRGVALQVMLFDPMRATMVVSPTFKIPTLMIFYEVCKKCKTIYSTGIELIETPAQMQIQRQPGPDMKGGRTGPF